MGLGTQRVAEFTPGVLSRHGDPNGSCLPSTWAVAATTSIRCRTLRETEAVPQSLCTWPDET